MKAGKYSQYPGNCFTPSPPKQPTLGLFVCLSVSLREFVTILLAT